MKGWPDESIQQDEGAVPPNALPPQPGTRWLPPGSSTPTRGNRGKAAGPCLLSPGTAGADVLHF